MPQTPSDGDPSLGSVLIFALSAVIVMMTVMITFGADGMRTLTIAINIIGLVIGYLALVSGGIAGRWP